MKTGTTVHHQSKLPSVAKLTPSNSKPATVRQFEFWILNVTGALAHSFRTALEHCCSNDHIGEMRWETSSLSWTSFVPTKKGPLGMPAIHQHRWGESRLAASASMQQSLCNKAHPSGSSNQGGSTVEACLLWTWTQTESHPWGSGKCNAYK